MRDDMQKIKKAWSLKYSAESAVKYCLRNPPAPFSGRWGKVEKCETYLIERLVDKLQAVMNVVWSQVAPKLPMWGLSPEPRRGEGRSVKKAQLRVRGSG